MIAKILELFRGRRSLLREIEQLKLSIKEKESMIESLTLDIYCYENERQIAKAKLDSQRPSNT
jgi:hypothetical protein